MSGDAISLPSDMHNQHKETTADNNTLGAASGDRHPTGQSTAQNMHNEYTEWQQEWGRQDELDRQRNLSILERAQHNPNQQQVWLGFMGFAKEEEARLARKLHWLKWEEQHVQNRQQEADTL